jgi:hypothetical protein
MTQDNTITGETLILGCFYFLRRGHLELDNHPLFKSKPAPIGTVHIWQDGKLHRKTLDGWTEVTEEDIPTGTFNGEIQILYDKRKFALIKQKLFGENLPTNRELAQMAGAHKNEKVTFIPTDKGIRIIIHHKDYVNDSTIFVDYKTHKPFISMGKVTKKEKLLKGLGFTFNAKFDLNKNSKNIKMFHRYLEEENGKNKDT